MPYFQMLPLKIMIFLFIHEDTIAPATIAPVVNPNVKHNPKPNHNPNLNPYPTPT